MNSTLNNVLSRLEEIYQLKSIVRYNNKPKLTSETVPEHSFYVALLGLMICDELKVSTKVTYEVLIKAILHDMPEIEINDITHDVKERLKLDEFLAKYEDEYYEKAFPKYADLMKRTSNVADYILNLADAMSVMQFASHEQMLGNHSNTMNEIFDESKNRVTHTFEEIKEMLK